MIKITSKKYLTIFILLFASMYSYAQYDSIPFAGYNRTYLLRLPDTYRGTTPLPMIIAMHGGFGNAYNIENQSQLSVKAEAENFIVVYPEGVKGGIFNIRTWNAGWCCGFAGNSNVDDVGFIDSLLNTLIRQYSIDTNRIYATGMSNGGFLSYRLACELSDRIAAISPVAASMSMINCDPLRPVPVISFHSYIDTHIPYYGGIGNGVSNHYNPPQDSVYNVWSNKSNCSNLNDTIVFNDQYTFIKSNSCECESEIHHYATRDGGHSWPGGVQTVTGDPVSNYINATDLMWSFFQQHTLNCDPFSVRNYGSENSNVKLYPNPTKGKLKIITNEIYDILEISVFNFEGQKIFNIDNKDNIDLSSFKRGVYFLKVVVSNKVIMEKVILI